MTRHTLTRSRRQTRLTRQVLMGSAIALSLNFSGAINPVFNPSTVQSQQAQAQQSQAAGWLSVQRLRGRVTYRGQQTRVARLGDRLDQVGTGISTASRSAVNLALDNDIGSVNVAENTNLQVHTLAMRSDGARVTILDVPRGQVRLQVRRFTNPNSRLEVHTPSGVAAVRGTDFGVSVDEDGKTAVATLSGAVETSAQNQSVMVNPGFVSVVRPGEAPSEPLPLDRELRFSVVDYGRMGRQISLVGDVDPANTVVIEGQEISISRRGRINTQFKLQQRRNFVDIMVSNPLGETRRQRLWMHHAN